MKRILLAARLQTWLTAFGLMACFSHSVLGQQDQTWDNGAGTDVWSTSAANWDGVAWTNDNKAVFGAAGAGAVNVDDAVTVGGITFNATGYNVGDPDANGTLTIGSGGIITVASGISATISETLSGTSGFTKAGAGTLLLAAANNTNTGNTVVSAGILSLGVNNALPSGTVTVKSGATLDLNLITDTNANARHYTIAGTGSASQGALVKTAGAAVTGSNAINGLTLSGDATVNTGVRIDLGGTINLSNYTLTKIGGDRLAFRSAVNNPNAALVLNAGGTYIEQNNMTIGSITVNNGAWFGIYAHNGADGRTVNGAITLKGSSGIWHGTNGTPSSPNNYEGTILVDGGVATLRTEGINGNASNITFKSVISGTGTIVLSGNNTGRAIRFDSANTFGGDVRMINQGIFRLGHSAALQNATLDTSTGTANSSLDFTNLTSATFGGLKGDKGFALQNASAAAVALTVGGNNQSTAFTGALTGSGSLTKVGTGTLTLGGNNTYAGDTTISQGTLALVAPIAGSAVWLDGTDISGTGVNPANGAAVATWTNKGALSAVSATQANTAARPTVLSGGINGLDVVRFDRAGGIDYLNLSDSSLADMINGSHTYFVVARTNNGGADDSSDGYNQFLVGTPGYHTGIRFGGGATSGATSVASDQWVGPSSQIATSLGYTQGAVAVACAVITETTGGSSNQLFLNGTASTLMTSTAQLRDYTSDLIRLGTANASGTYVWGLTGEIAEVILYPFALDAGQRQIVEAYLQSKWLGATGVIPDTSRVSIAAGATLDLSGRSETIGSLVGAGTVTSSQAGTAILTVGADNTALAEFSGVIQNGAGTVGLTKIGTGVQILSGANTYSGPTVVNGGVLKVTSLAALPTNVTVNAGGTFDVNALHLQPRSFTIAGTGAAGQIGALVNTASGSEASVENVILAANATIGTSGSKLNVYGTINGGGHVLTVVGTSETNIRINNSLTDLAGITVNTAGSGRLRMESSQAPATPFAITVNSGAIVDSWADRTYGANLALNLNGGSLQANGGTGEFTAVWNGAVSLSGTPQVAANKHIQLLGTISGSGGLTKTGDGTLTLRGDNSYTGGTSVSAGTLLVNNTSGSGTGSGAVTINSGATLGGTGALGGAVTVRSGGWLRPGASPGVLAMDSLLLESGSTTVMEIDGLLRGTEYDGIDIGTENGLAYGGTLSLAFGNSTLFPAGTVLDLFSFTGTASGSFASVVSTGDYYAGTWAWDNVDTFSLDYGWQTLLFNHATGDLTIVPEPTAWAMLLVGLMGLACRRGRRHMVR
ncbi:MAG: autotransporter-associated beta strand repeat-containing protein [Patescibacteria group bacterium]|nr:autotransporter-associated beta strand repeat-containing protein [Patescibacteria group bacterium]